MARHATAALLLTVGLSIAQTEPLRLQPDPDHPFAAALAGNWIADPALQHRLGPTKAPCTLSFHDDPTVLTSLPPAVTKALAERRLYAAGKMEREGDKQVYVLSERAGTAELLTFRTDSPDPVRGGEQLVVMLVRAQVAASDMLFVNGAVGRKPFAAFRRLLPTPAKLEPTAAITEMARLLESKQYELFFQTWCLPADLAKLTEGGRSLANAAAKFAETKGAERSRPCSRPASSLRSSTLPVTKRCSKARA